MKLYAIRIENGETAVVSGDSEQDALRNAGITEEVFDDLRKQGHDIEHAALVESGFAPQRYEIIELTDFGIRLKINEIGDLEMSEMDENTRDALSPLYPIMEAALSDIHTRWSSEEILTTYNSEYRQRLVEARSQELTRLMMPSNFDDV